MKEIISMAAKKNYLLHVVFTCLFLFKQYIILITYQAKTIV